MRPVAVTFWNSTTCTEVGGDPGYMVHPCQSGVVFGDFFANPVPCLKAVSVSYGIPWVTCYDDFFTVLVGGLVGHLEGLEAFPCLAL